MKIISSVEQLRSRNKCISQILKPLALNHKRLAIYPSNTPERWIITVRDSNNTYSDNNYTNYRFKTFVPNLKAMYYEKWVKFYPNEKSKKESYYLDRAYLHFYTIEESLNEEKEFLLIHCDPNEPDTAAHAKYKQSLHLHIECSDASWPHCDVCPHAHIALNAGYLKAVLASVDSLTEAIKEAVFMVKEEVLDQMPRK